jgi:hypothetical protein
MVLQKEDPALGAAAGLPDASLQGSLDTQGIAPKPSQTQAISRNPRAVFETLQENCLAEGFYLLANLIIQAEIAQSYTHVGDVRGYLYSLGKIVELAIRAGDEGLAFRELRETRRKELASINGRQP